MVNYNLSAQDQMETRYIDGEYCVLLYSAGTLVSIECYGSDFQERTVSVAGGVPSHTFANDHLLVIRKGTTLVAENISEKHIIAATGKYHPRGGDASDWTYHFTGPVFLDTLGPQQKFELGTSNLKNVDVEVTGVVFADGTHAGPSGLELRSLVRAKAVESKSFLSYYRTADGLDSLADKEPDVIQSEWKMQHVHNVLRRLLLDGENLKETAHFSISLMLRSVESVIEKLG